MSQKHDVITAIIKLNPTGLTNRQIWEMLDDQEKGCFSSFTDLSKSTDAMARFNKGIKKSHTISDGHRPEQVFVSTETTETIPAHPIAQPAAADPQPKTAQPTPTTPPIGYVLNPNDHFELLMTNLVKTYRNLHQSINVNDLLPHLNTLQLYQHSPTVPPEDRAHFAALVDAITSIEQAA
jgi:hypothetical protein